MPDRKPGLKLLFLCTGNSCRSQVAEGWARALRGDALEPFSASVEIHGLNPLAVEVMVEAGIEISHDRGLRDAIRAFVASLPDAREEA